MPLHRTPWQRVLAGVDVLTGLFTRRRRRPRHPADDGGPGAARADAAESRAFERISGTLAHDLRNPLNTIGLNVHLAQKAFEHGDSALGGMAIDHIDRAKQQMVESVERFRALARALYGEVEREPVDVAALARLAFDRLADPGVELTVGELPKSDGDPRLAAALLWGLIASAMEATQGQSRRHVEVGYDADAEPLPYYVEDNGAVAEGGNGAAWRRSESKSPVDPWLELAARALARQGGELRAASRPGGGAVVRFRLGGLGRHDTIESEN